MCFVCPLVAYLWAVLYLETSSLQLENAPKLPGIFRLLLQKTGHWPVHDIKSFATGTFLSWLLLKEQMKISHKKNLVQDNTKSKRDGKANGGFEHKMGGSKKATF